MTIHSAVSQGTRLLEEGGIAAPRLTSEVLLCHALHRERAYLYAHPEEELTHIAWIHYGGYLHERMLGKPTQYITGRQEFYGREFRVTPDVFIPRPETEHVVETALRIARGARAIVDVGCGSGAIAVTLACEVERPVFATDTSLPSLRIAGENACRLRAEVRFVACDLCSAFADRSLDLVVSNPPYIPMTEEAGLPREVREFEPRQALFAGAEGLDCYRRLVLDAERVLRPGGYVVFEIGYQQAEAVSGLFGPRWAGVEVVADLAGLPRVITAEFSAADERR